MTLKFIRLSTADISFKIFLAFFGLCALSACSTLPTAQELESDAMKAKFAHSLSDSFTTDIHQSGLKLFTYRAQLKNQTNEPAIAANVNQRTQRSPKQRQGRQTAADLSQWTQQVEHGLAQTLAMTQFCREGFFELSRIIEANRGTIRGECKEGSSEADITKFAPSSHK